MKKACEENGKCDYDQRVFKGIAIRSFARAAQSAPIVADSIYKMLNTSAKGAAQNCDGSGDDVACRLSWSSSGDSSWEQATADDGNLGEVLNAFQAVQALLWRTADFGNSASNSTSSNATTSGSPPGTSGALQSTGAGSTFVASFSFVLAVAFAAALSCEDIAPFVQAIASYEESDKF